MLELPAQKNIGQSLTYLNDIVENRKDSLMISIEKYWSSDLPQAIPKKIESILEDDMELRPKLLLHLVIESAATHPGITAGFGGGRFSCKLMSLRLVRGCE